MNEIENRILLAQQDSKELDHLLADYLPFIKKQLINTAFLGLEYDDMLSLAMLTFVNCVRQYCIHRGSFLNFTAICIKNRLIDEGRRCHKHTSEMASLDDNEESASVANYSIEQEHKDLVEEIELLSVALARFDISFTDLPRICPKQSRARNQCMRLARTVVEDEVMRNNLNQNHRISQTELARQFNISVKTIEKHRKYIVTLALLFMGDYPGIRTFLPHYQEVK